MQKSALLAAIQREIYRHDFGTYVVDPPTIAQGGRGIVVADSSLQEAPSVYERVSPDLTEDAMPALLDRLSNSA